MEVLQFKRQNICNEITELVKILAPLTDNPNAPNKQGKTPIGVSKNAKIRGILEAFETSRKLKSGPSTKQF